MWSGDEGKEAFSFQPEFKDGDGNNCGSEEEEEEEEEEMKDSGCSSECIFRRTGVVFS